MADRTATTQWTGGLAHGEGMVTFGTGALGPVRVSWLARTETTDTTSPEELIAAAHSSCYSMALSHEIAEAGGTPGSVRASATVTFDAATATVTRSHLVVEVHADGLDEEAIRAAAMGAKAGCPVSRALAGVEITIDVSVV